MVEALTGIRVSLVKVASHLQPIGVMALPLHPTVNDFVPTVEVMPEGRFNARYGSDPRCDFYTHVSDQYASFYTKLINECF